MCVTVWCGTVVLVEWALSNPDPHHTLTLTLTLTPPLPLPLPLPLTSWAELSAAAEAEEASIRATWVSMAKVAWLAAAHAATHRSRGPPAGSRLPSALWTRKAHSAAFDPPGAALMGANINVDWAFSKGPSRRR